MKAARDREAMQTDLEVLKERYEKSHAIQQKLQVIFHKKKLRQREVHKIKTNWLYKKIYIPYIQIYIH